MSRNLWNRLPWRVLTGCLAVALAAGLAVPAQADFVDIDLADWSAAGDFGDANNTKASFNLEPFANITSVEFNLVFEAFDSSWRSDLKISLYTSDPAGDFWDDAPAWDVDGPGEFSGSGFFRLPPENYAGRPFSLLEDGILNVQIYDPIDNGVEPFEATISEGTLRVNYSPIPEPSTVGLLAVGSVCVLGYGYRRRRKAALLR